MLSKTKLMIIQPYLTKYRLPIFKELTIKYDVVIAASRKESYGNITEDDLGDLKNKTLHEKQFFSGKLLWQIGLLSLLFKYRPNVIFASANPRYISTWLVIFLSKLMSIKVILHGQGLYNKPVLSPYHKVLFGLFSFFSNKYVCYTESCKSSLYSMRIYEKSVVAENSIENQYPIKKVTNDESGILFIGRLRSNSNIEMLANTIVNLQKEGGDINLYVVGGGDKLDEYKNKYLDYSFIKFLGEIYDSKDISLISHKCFAGCYPGNAGLSVLHYMSLSLPPIAHSSMTEHMGPEPSYIENQYNGILFTKDSSQSLLESIKKLYMDDALKHSLQVNAYATYEKLTKPSLGQRFLSVIENTIRE